MIYILIGILLLIFIISLPDTGESTANSSKDMQSTVPVVEEPTKLFDPNNPNEIFDLVNTLSTVVANAGDSWLIVYLQDENQAKGWKRQMGLLATIDDWNSKGFQVDEESFTKLGLSASCAKYLASVPFIISGDELKYDFTAVFDYPSNHDRFIVDEMQSGVAKSSYVMFGLRRISIQNNAGIIECKSD